MSEDMSEIINKLGNMINNNEFPDEFKNILGNASNNNNEGDNQTDFDINTILKMKKIIDAMNYTKDDPRANLLRSLKPYLKDSRKEKIEQYIKLFNMGKVFDIMNYMGGDKKSNV